LTERSAFASSSEVQLSWQRTPRSIAAEARRFKARQGAELAAFEVAGVAWAIAAGNFRSVAWAIITSFAEAGSASFTAAAAAASSTGAVSASYAAGAVATSFAEVAAASAEPLGNSKVELAAKRSLSASTAGPASPFRCKLA